jgi:hypothetical protein
MDAPGQAFISTGSGPPGLNYTVMGVVFATNSNPNPNQALFGAATLLKEQAVAAGADAVLFAGFAPRPALAKGCFGTVSQTFEVMAWGTCVKLLR